MSYTPNTLFLENAKDDFDYAMEMGDYNVADDVIKKIADAGFTKESVALALELAKQINQDKLEDVKLDSI